MDAIARIGNVKEFSADEINLSIVQFENRVIWSGSKLEIHDS